MATGICAALLRYKPQYTWPGLILVLLGVPVYLFWSRRGTTGVTPDGGNGADLVAAMQASPHKEIDLEPERGPMPVRDVPP